MFVTSFFYGENKTKKRFNGYQIVFHTITIAVWKEMLIIGRRKGVMSEGFKEELAKELGFYDVVQRDGWGGIKARDAGNMVKRAVEIAQQSIQNNR